MSSPQAGPDAATIRALRYDLSDMRDQARRERARGVVVCWSAALTVGMIVALGLPYMRAITGNSNAYVPVTGWRLPITSEGIQDDGFPFPALARIAIVLAVLATIWSWGVLANSVAAKAVVVAADVVVIVVQLFALHAINHSGYSRDSGGAHSTIPLMGSDVGTWVVPLLLGCWVVVGGASIRQTVGAAR